MSYTFNQLDKESNLSNFQFTHEQIETQNYKTNSIRIKIFDVKNEQCIIVCFPKGTSQSLFKEIKAYGLKNKKIFNIGINTSHWFHTWVFDINSNKLIKNGKMSYFQLHDLLQKNHTCAMQKANHWRYSDTKAKFQLENIKKIFNSAKEILAKKEEENKIKMIEGNNKNCWEKKDIQNQKSKESKSFFKSENDLLRIINGS